MADKHVISFTMIYNFFKEHSAQLERGENSYRSGNVLSMRYDPPLIVGEVAASMKKKSIMSR